MTRTSNKLVLREERKREAAWMPAARWRVIQETITWAERQGTARRNTPEACIRIERQRSGRSAARP